jgi:hypothetical protein
MHSENIMGCLSAPIHGLLVFQGLPRSVTQRRQGERELTQTINGFTNTFPVPLPNTRFVQNLLVGMGFLSSAASRFFGSTGWVTLVNRVLGFEVERASMGLVLTDVLVAVVAVGVLPPVVLEPPVEVPPRLNGFGVAPFAGLGSVAPRMQRATKRRRPLNAIVRKLSP